MATTKVDPKLNEATLAKTGQDLSGPDDQQLIDAYRIMFASRRVDDREILLKRQQKVFFQISGAGHEALGVVPLFALKPSYDWFYPYYRDRSGLALAQLRMKCCSVPWARPTIPIPAAADALALAFKRST